jgi:hypothetical protein
MNLEKLIAENMLRFGVKNLSESDIKKLQEQNPPRGSETNPKKLAGATVTAKSAEKKLEASFKRDDNKIATWSASVKMDPKTKKWNLVDFRFSPDGQPAVAPLTLENNKIMQGDIKALLGNGELGYTGPGMSPLASLNNLLSQVAKQTGVQYGIHVDLQNTLANLPNRYYTYKSAIIPKGSYLKPGISYGVKSLINPDTNQVINRTLYIGDKYSNAYQIVIDQTGKLRGSGVNSIQTVVKNLFQGGSEYLNVSPTDDYAKDNVLKSISSLQYQTLL